MKSFIEFLRHDALKYVVAALIGGLVTEFLKAWRKKRLSVEAACLPSFALTVKDGLSEVRVFGKYSVLNLSDLPVSLAHYNFLLYNAASRALQFNLAKSNVPLREWFAEQVIPPNTETVLVSDKEWLVGGDRCWIRRLPLFLWLEVLEQTRIGSRRVLRYKAELYVRSYWSRESKQAMYRPTSIELGARFARSLALPGKLIHRYKGRKI